MRLYVIGADGQVARSLREAASVHDDIVFGFGTRPDVDLLHPKSIHAAIAKFRPDAVVNPAAFTAVDRAESEPNQAFALNRDGARADAIAAANQDAPVIHLSTDYVFDGNKIGAYVESDAVAPQGVYGRSSLREKQAVAEAIPPYRASNILDLCPFWQQFCAYNAPLGRGTRPASGRRRSGRMPYLCARYRNGNHSHGTEADKLRLAFEICRRYPPLPDRMH